MLGFDIMFNFHLPYAATSLREFWRRWHISLSTWLRDYLYISLGGNRRGAARTYLNLLLTMLLGGLWHGAAWNFVLWGAWHGSGLMVERASGKSRHLESRICQMWAGVVAWLATMLFVFYGWMLFRAGSLDQILAMTRALGDFSAPVWLRSYVINLVVFAAPLVLMQLWQRRRDNLLPPWRCRAGHGQAWKACSCSESSCSGRKITCRFSTSSSKPQPCKATSTNSGYPSAFA